MNFVKDFRMGNKRIRLISSVTIAVLIAVSSAVAEAQDDASTSLETTAASIDYAGFLELATTLEPIREQRLIDLNTFNEMKLASNTIILDTRSTEAFMMGHIEGAINLPFSDFTTEKLERIIPKKSTRILIYCNNNFSDNVSPIMLKRVELALNVPTFINLWGYGYKNIYELGSYTESSDPRVNWVSNWPHAHEN